MAILLPNIPQYPAIYFGILKAGGVCVSCNPVFTVAELNYQLKDSGAGTVFCMDHPDLYSTASKAVSGTDVKTVVVCNIKSYLPKAKGFVGSLFGKIPKAGTYDPDHLHLDNIVKTFPPEPPKVKINPTEDIALILYTGALPALLKGHPSRTPTLCSISWRWKSGCVSPMSREKDLKNSDTGVFTAILDSFPGITVSDKR